MWDINKILLRLLITQLKSRRIYVGGHCAVSLSCSVCQPVINRSSVAIKINVTSITSQPFNFQPIINSLLAFCFTKVSTFTINTNENVSLFLNMYLRCFNLFFYFGLLINNDCFILKRQRTREI